MLARYKTQTHINWAKIHSGTQTANTESLAQFGLDVKWQTNTHKNASRDAPICGTGPATPES